MTKRGILILLAIIIAISGGIVLASAEDYTLFIDTSQNVLKNVPVKTDVKLIGNNAPAYQNVRIKVDVSGPGTPKLMATDSENIEWDIAQIGYWGPPEGFAVGGTFTNTTPVTATFPESGLYEIELWLINVTDGKTITSSKESIYVYKDQQELDDVLAGQNKVNNIVGNTSNIANSTNITNTNSQVNTNVVENLPQTGTSIGEYMTYAGIIVSICLVGYFITRNYRIKS